MRVNKNRLFPGSIGQSGGQTKKKEERGGEIKLIPLMEDSFKSKWQQSR